MTAKSASNATRKKTSTTSPRRKKTTRSSSSNDVEKALKLLKSKGYSISFIGEDETKEKESVQTQEVAASPVPTSQQQPQPQPVQQQAAQTKIKLPSEYYKYRYFMNSNHAAIHLSDLKVFIDVDETNKKVVRFTEEDIAKSRELGGRIARGNLIEVTKEYLGFLELGYAPSQWWYDIPTKVRLESFNATIRQPQPTNNLIPVDEGPIVDQDSITRVQGASDAQAHMAKFSHGMREDQVGTSAIEEVLGPGDANSNPIVEDSYVDRSNPNSFVDPRMRSNKMPASPTVQQMRDGNYALSNNREMYPYTTDHHERAMIQANAQQPYTHIPQNYNPNQPIQDAVPQKMMPQQQGQPQVQQISQDAARQMFQAKQQQAQARRAGSSAPGPQVSQTAQEILQSVNI